MDTAALVFDVFAQLGIETQLLGGASDLGVDLVLDPGGAETPVLVKRRSLVTDDAARRLLAETPTTAVLLVVADRVTAKARTELTSARGGYLDLRGRLAIRTERMVIDTDVEPFNKQSRRTNALAGKAGVEIGTALLMQPKRSAAVRELARELERSPSTVSEVLAALRQDELIDSKNTVPDSRLFWQVADHWPTARTHLARLPIPGDATLATPLRLGLDDIEEQAGWALTDSAAAAAYGAPLALRTDQLLDFFVPDQSIVRRAKTLLGATDSVSNARGTVRVAPVPAVVGQRVDLGTTAIDWPLAHPVFVALDLAQDGGRGREILDAWTPDDRWHRVW